MPDPRLKTYPPQAARRLGAAGAGLLTRQERSGSRRGNVLPWPGADDPDFHGTLAAIWVWARHAELAGADHFARAREAAWTFVEGAAPHFIPSAPQGIAGGPGDEAAYDCAMVLVAAVAERKLAPPRGGREQLISRAAQALAHHLEQLRDVSGRAFADPGFAAHALLQHASAVGDRALFERGRRFVDRAFGLAPPSAFAREPVATGELFDFSSTSATRVLAVMAAEGTTPFVGAWLRDRVAPNVPRGFLPRPLDESTWNASVAWALGRAYVVSTDPVFLNAFNQIMRELERRATAGEGGGPSREATVRGAQTASTASTFYFGLAVDALLTAAQTSAREILDPLASTPTPPPSMARQAPPPPGMPPHGKPHQPRA